MEESAYYHIYNRGNNKENIFTEEDNYIYFLSKYDKYLGNLVDTYSYCLMPNHFHLLIKVKEVKDITEQEAFSNISSNEKKSVVNSI